MHGNNVLLVILDSTRAQNTSLHGYERETTPFLETFADRSTVYTQARAPSIHSIASHVSMFTGTHVEEHEAMHHTAQIDLDQTVWRELSDRGYTTGLFTNNRIVSNASNLGEAFDYKFQPDYPLATRLENTLGNEVVENTYFRLYDGFSRLSERARTEVGKRDRLDAVLTGAAERVGSVTGAVGGDETDDGGFKTLHGSNFTDAFLDWEQRQDGPWAACLNLMDTHSPYRPEPEHDLWADEANRAAQNEGKPSVRECLRGEGWEQVEALEPLYDGTIRQADAIIEDLVGELESRDLLEETLVVVTSDHGEAFGEESRVDPAVRLRGHKWGIHEVLTHVPLVVSYPNQTEGRVVEEVVSLTDTPRLLQSATSDDAGDPLVSEQPVLASTFRLPESKLSKYRSVEGVERYVGPWRAVYETDGGTVRKYAQKGTNYATLEISPGEVTVVSTEPHDRVSDVFESLADDSILTEESTEIDDDLEDRLEDLGYIR